MSVNLEHSSLPLPPGITYNRRAIDMTSCPASLAETQAEILDRDRAARYFQAYAPVFVPGLLQTKAYAYTRLMEAAELLGLPLDAVDATVALRMDRGQLLDDESRELHAVIGEPVLYAGGGAAVMMGQLRRLLRAAQRSNVKLGVLPMRTAARVADPMSHVNITDREEVSVETLAVTYRITAGPEIAMYLRVFDVLADAARYGDDAAALIESALSWWGRGGDRV